MKKRKNVGKNKGKIKEDGSIIKHEKQIKIAIYFMLFLLIVILLIYLFVQGANSFEYAGLKFEKKKQGSLDFYFAKIPLRDITGNVVGYSSMALRNDPRTLEDIGVNGMIRLKKDTALAADKEFVEGCEDSILAATTLSLFLNRAGIKSFPATTDKTEAELEGRTYVNCEEADEYSLVEYEKADKDEITRKGDCYLLKVANCNVMNVTERFMIATYADSRGIDLR